MKFRTLIIGAACATAMTVGTAGAAMAGEVNGNGKELPLKGASLCKFSGLNDEQTPEEPTRTQSYGTFLQLYGKWAAAGMGTSPGAGIRMVKGGLPSPGMACNPNGGFEE